MNAIAGGPANDRRGEVALAIAGVPHVLRLTLQGLAELEAAFGVADLAALGERFASGRLASRDLITILAAGLRGGGLPVSDSQVAEMQLDGGPAAALAATMRLLLLTFGSSETGASQTGAGEAAPSAAPLPAGRTPSVPLQHPSPGMTRSPS